MTDYKNQQGSKPQQPSQQKSPSSQGTGSPAPKSGERSSSLRDSENR